MKKLGESKEKWHKAGYEDGYRKGVEDVLELVEGEYEELAEVVRDLLKKRRKK